MKQIKRREKICFLINLQWIEMIVNVKQQKVYISVEFHYLQILFLKHTNEQLIIIFSQLLKRVKISFTLNLFIDYTIFIIMNVLLFLRRIKWRNFMKPLNEIVFIVAVMLVA